MRVKSIALSWFRGAATRIALDTHTRSFVVYGPNAAGKSSFVDAFEYVLRNGRIQHLAHEYSGRHQERAVLNTHRPDGCSGTIDIIFADGLDVRVIVATNGSHSMSGDGVAHLSNWDCARTVLRQDEVSRFIHSTKGEKYSVLLPLLGLSHLETAAENLHQLSAAILKQSGAREAAGALNAAKSQFEATFGKATQVSSELSLRRLCSEYVVQEHEHSARECARLIGNTIDGRLADATEQQRIQIAVEQLGLVDVRSGINGVRSAAATLALSADKMVQAQLEVLRATDDFLGLTEVPGTVSCPACGRSVAWTELADHVRAETERLDAVIAASNEYRRQSRELRETVNRAVRLCGSSEIVAWASGESESMRNAIQEAATFRPLADIVDEEQLGAIESKIIPAVVAAASAAAFLPTPASELARAKEKLIAARSLFAAEEAVAQSAKGEGLATEVKRREGEVREKIRVQSEAVIRAISADVQRMWRTLHPGEPIEDVRLKVTQDTDKAIDIALKFHGKELESPRLTLSEGYRNSLGLCVFLAMAARDITSDSPIVLDDVIVSLDRGHRGMVADLIRTEFPGRQVIILTHDRDWYSDLRLQLSGKDWHFAALLPYRTPELGITWAGSAGTFGDARSYLETRPDTAANEARKVMDVELAKHAERIGLNLPFVRGDKNDKRGAHEFLEQFITQGRASYRIRRQNGTYEPYDRALAAFEAADRLLISWANRGSHSDDVVRTEADKVISACEAALSVLRCDECMKYVTYAEVNSNGSVQCQCGKLRWK